LRWPQYQAAEHLVTDPVDWKVRFPELDGQLISMEPVVKVRNYESQVNKPFVFTSGEGSYCALVGYVRSASDEQFRLEVIRRASFGAYLAGRAAAIYESPDTKYISLHIPIPQNDTFLLRIYYPELFGDVVVNSDVSVGCWKTSPHEILKPFQGL
jgi:hypothetical protein